jgi:hypothetical protein
VTCNIIGREIRSMILSWKMSWNIDDRQVGLEGDGANVKQMSEREEIYTSNMVSIRTVEAWRECNSRSNFNVNRVDSVAKVCPVVNERKVWVKAEVSDKVLHSSKVDRRGMHLILGKGDIGRKNIKTSPECNVHAALKNCAILEAKLMFTSCFEFLVIQGNSSCKRLRIGSSCTHQYGA